MTINSSLSNNLLVLTGESGSGKSTIEKELTLEGYIKGISLTSRSMRLGEVDGVDYYFRSKEHLYQLKSEGKIVEWIEFMDNIYALTMEECMRADILVVEPNGLLQLQGIEGLNLSVVYLNCSEDERERRMLGRGDSSENVEKRIINDRTHFTGVSEVCNLEIDVTNQSISETLHIVREFI